MQVILDTFPQIIQGAGVTLKLFGLTILGSIPLGVLLAFLLRSRFYPVKLLIQFYVWLMRGTPLLLQLILVFYGLPYIGIVFDRFEAALIAFILNYAGSNPYLKANMKQPRCCI